MCNQVGQNSTGDEGISLVSWRVTSCAAKIQHFDSYFRFDFAQSYQILAHDQIHYYAAKCYSNYYATELSLVVGERLSDWDDE